MLEDNAAGFPRMSVHVLGGDHGAGICGVHGCGVRTPSAAAVAAATAGFAIDVHIPNGMTFANGLLSMILARGVFSVTFGSATTS